MTIRPSTFNVFRYGDGAGAVVFVEVEGLDQVFTEEFSNFSNV